MSLDTEPPCKKTKTHSMDVAGSNSKLVMEASVDIEEVISISNKIAASQISRLNFTILYCNSESFKRGFIFD